MNKQNFNQSGGFPIKTQTLDAMQTAYSLFNSLGEMAGNFAIISGCETIGMAVSNGTVYINGELFDFRGGPIGANVIIVEEVSPKEFKDGNSRDVVYVRYAAFGIAAITYPWTNFKRPKTTLELTDQKAEKETIEALIKRIEDLEARPEANVPKGMIAIWDRPANEIPRGWVEYTRLAGRMPVGLNELDSDFDLVGKMGGTKIKQIETTTPNSGYGITGNPSAGGNEGKLVVASGFGEQSEYLESLSIAQLTPKGKGEVNVLNPYRVVHFIQYIG